MAFGLLAFGRAEGQSDHAASCPATKELRVDTIRTARGNPVYVEGPVAASSVHGTLVLGTYALQVRPDGSGEIGGGSPVAFPYAGIRLTEKTRAEMIFRVDSSVVEGPPVVLSGVDDGKPLVLWPVRDTSTHADDRRPETVITGIVAQKRWTRVRAPGLSDSLVRAIWWRPPAVSPVIGARQGSSFVAATSLWNGALAWVTWQSGHWQYRVLNLPVGSYPRAVARRDGITLAYVRGTSDVGNALFVTRLESSGRELAPPTRLGPRGVDIVDPVLLRGTGRAVLAIWHERPRDGSPATIAYARSDDDGVTWRGGPSLALTSAVDGLTARLDPNETLFVAARLRAERGPTLLFASLERGAWRVYTAPQSDGASRGLPAILPLVSSGADVLWGAVAERSGRPPILLRGSVRTACASKPRRRSAGRRALDSGHRTRGGRA